MPVRPLIAAGIAALLIELVGCRTPSTVSPVVVSVPTGAILPVGTPLGLRLDQALGVGTSGVGNPFRATVVSLVVSEGGALVIPSGTEVFGTVTGLVPPSARLPAAVRLAFDRIRLRGTDYPLSAAVLRTDAAEAVEGGRGAVADDALLQALGESGLGEGPGTTLSLGTDPASARLPVGTVLLVTTDRPIVLR